MKWPSLVKFLLGSVLGIAILLGGGLAISYYFLTRLTQAPPKPTFANEQTNLPNPPEAQVRSQAAAAPTASPAITDTPLEPGAYRAVVVYPEGLLLRDRPGYDAGRIGGVAYNQPVVVLEESADKVWQRLRVDTGEEGWVKAGNVQRVP